MQGWSLDSKDLSYNLHLQRHACSYTLNLQKLISTPTLQVCKCLSQHMKPNKSKKANKDFKFKSTHENKKKKQGF